jgi:uncharacterized membrane protein
MKTNEFLNQLRDDEIVRAIVEAEERTSGEIRIFVTRHAVAEPLPAALRQFDRLGMSETAARNGVLLYFAPRSRRFAIVGDEAIHGRCGEEFWRSVSGEMETLLKEGHFTEAVVAGIRRAGEVLGRHFPRRPDDRNELPDRVGRD